MAATKYEIQNWISKCKTKALLSVKDAHIEDLTKLIAGNKELTKMYKVGLAYQDAKKAYEELYTANGLPTVKLNSYFINCSYGSMYSSDGNPIHSIGAIVSKSADKFPKEYAIVDAAIKHYNAVSAEYHNLIVKCDALKPRAAVEYLVAIGFDVATLGQATVTIDTSKLFVCNDNKPG